MPNLDQRRAEFALAKVRGVADSKEKYLTELRKLPSRLHASGLGQSVAFYLAAGPKSPEVAICDWLSDWLAKRGIYDNPKAAGLMTAIASDKTNHKYRQASAEARAIAVWLKRFAEAFLEGTPGAGVAPAGETSVESRERQA